MTIEKHKYYDLAYRAHSGSSFVPEKRAVSDCEWYDSVCKEFKDAGKDWAIEKFSSLFIKQLSAKNRCYSVMIAGPARFPVARMEKLNRWEHNATEKLLAFIEKVRRPPVSMRTELDYGIEQKEYEIGEVRVLHNVEENRLQLFYPGKPESETITKLKSRGFKWSPRNKAWQRQLTPNAILALPDVIASKGLHTP